MAKHFGFKVMARVTTTKHEVHRKVKNSGRFETRSGAEDFAKLYEKQYPGSDPYVTEDIRGEDKLPES